MNENLNIQDFNYIKNNQDKYNWDLMNVINQLSYPTDPQHIKYLKSGQKYVSGSYVIQKLNQLFLMQWSFQVIREIYQQSAPNKQGQQQNPTVQVLGRLTIPGLGVREQWGSSVVKGGADVQESDYKSATTDALKKCASMFGVAMDLYTTEPHEFIPTTSNDIQSEKDKELNYFKSKGSFYEYSKQKAYEENLKKKEEAKKKALEKQVVPEIPQKEVVQTDVVQEESKSDTVNQNLEKALTTEIEEKDMVNIGDNFIPEGVSEINEEVIEDTNEDTPERPIEPSDNGTSVNEEAVKESIPKPVVEEKKYTNPNILSNESIQKLKELKDKLGIKDNNELSAYLVEFFQDASASAHWIDAKNIHDILLFLEKKLENN